MRRTVPRLEQKSSGDGSTAEDSLVLAPTRLRRGTPDLGVCSREIHANFIESALPILEGNYCYKKTDLVPWAFTILVGFSVLM